MVWMIQFLARVTISKSFFAGRGRTPGRCRSPSSRSGATSPPSSRVSSPPKLSALRCKVVSKRLRETMSSSRNLSDGYMHLRVYLPCDDHAVQSGSAMRASILYRRKEVVYDNGRRNDQNCAHLLRNILTIGKLENSKFVEKKITKMQNESACHVQIVVYSSDVQNYIPEVANHMKFTQPLG